MYWSGKSTTQSYIWKLKKLTDQSDICAYSYVQHDCHITWYSCRLTVTRRVLLVELICFEHPNSPSIYRGTCSSIFGFLHVECFADHCLSLCSFSFGHCVACPSSILINAFSIFKLFLNACNYILLWIAIKDVHFRQFVWKF